MEFDGQYLTFNEYKSLGGSLEEENAFNLLEYETRKKLDLRTLRRLVKLEQQPQEVKTCMFHLMNKVQSINESNEKNKSNGIYASETVGSYSVSYLTGSQIQEIIKLNSEELDRIIVEDLFGLVVNNEHVINLGVR